jgi:recombinational DNA repair protein (RecF pathway)
MAHKECDRCGTEIGFNEVSYGTEIIICGQCQDDLINQRDTKKPTPLTAGKEGKNGNEL